MLNTAVSLIHAEALDLNEQVLALGRRVLPADHPDIPTIMMNMAGSFFALGRQVSELMR